MPVPSAPIGFSSGTKFEVFIHSSYKSGGYTSVLFKANLT